MWSHPSTACNMNTYAAYRAHKRFWDAMWYMCGIQSRPVNSIPFSGLNFMASADHRRKSVITGEVIRIRRLPCQAKRYVLLIRLRITCVNRKGSAAATTLDGLVCVWSIISLLSSSSVKLKARWTCFLLAAKRNSLTVLATSFQGESSSSSKLKFPISILS